MDKFNQEVEALRKHVAEVLDRNSKAKPQQEMLQESFEELNISLEELNVASAELCQQMEEVEITRAAVKAESQRYQELFEEAPEGYLVTDANGIIREANRAAATLLNLEQHFLVGKPLIIFFTQEMRQVFRSKLNQLGLVERVQEWEVQLLPRKGVPIDAALSVALVRNREGESFDLRWLLRDITERKRTEAALLRAQVAEATRIELEKEIALRKLVEEQLRHNAFHDALTGLPNRALFMDRLEQAVEYHKRHEDYLFAVLFLDLDRFKIVNDSLGHILGDQFLVTIALRLKACLRPTDTVARLGGDEFTILLEGLKDISDAVCVAERIQQELAKPFVLGSQEVFTTASIGIALSATDYERPEKILRDADIAMYRAKAQGKARYEIFNTNMHIRAVARLQLESALRRAIKCQELRIHYQPIVSLLTGRITGFEALVRWQHPEKGIVLPGEFMPTATETGLSISIDEWVLHEACRQTKQWQRFPPSPAALGAQPLTISVNLCGSQFKQQNLLQQISQVLQKTGLDANSLKLEITENVIMENGAEAIVRLEQLRDLGIQLYVDDFGTGYSSLGRLHRFPINGLKIDRSFVSGNSVAEGNLDIVETIVILAQKLGVKVIAEGVETQEQLALLRTLKCEFGQGYFFSKPLDSSTAETLIMANPQW